MGEINFPQAVAEFHKELENNPTDYFSHSQLGYIDLSQHKLDEAVAELTKATELNPQDPDAFLSLGQAYSELNKPTKPKPRFANRSTSRWIPRAITTRCSARTIFSAASSMQAGRTDDAKKEMAESENLSRQIDPSNALEPSLQTFPPPPQSWPEQDQ